MSEKPILEVRDVTKAFGGIMALNRVSFRVRGAEILGIIGPNGSGKTTLINCITGFIRMTSGKVLFRGKDISRKPPHRIADMGITRTFQIMRPYYSLPAYKNLIIPLFSPRAKRTGGWRGGGKQQMLAIGRALMAQPRLLLLDEPLLGLSPLMQAMLVRATREIRDEKGLSIIVTEQYARPVMPIVDYAFIMENGAAVLEGTGEEVMNNPDVRSAYFGV